MKRIGKGNCYCQPEGWCWQDYYGGKSGCVSGVARTQGTLIDSDPQGNATSGFGFDKRDIKQCIYDAIISDVPMQDVIKHTAYKGLDWCLLLYNLPVRK